MTRRRRARLPAERVDADPALRVEGLTVDIRTISGTVRAVDKVSFAAHRGETLALLASRCCGKSMTATALVGCWKPVAEVVEARPGSRTSTSWPLTSWGSDCGLPRAPDGLQRRRVVRLSRGPAGRRRYTQPSGRVQSAATRRSIQFRAAHGDHRHRSSDPWYRGATERRIPRRQSGFDDGPASSPRRVGSSGTSARSA